MSAATLALSGLVSLVSGAAFLHVGLRAIPRRVSAENQLARQAFGAYWAALGAYTAMLGAMDLLAAAGHAPFPLFLAVRLVSLPFLVVSVCGAAYYFLHLFTGDQRWVWPIAFFGAALLVGITYFVADREPIGVAVGAWRTDIQYANPYETPVFNVLVLLLALPPIVGSLAYLTLAPALRGDARRRAVMVGASILLWSLAALVARLGEGSDLVQLLARPVLGVAAAAIVVRAYRPTGPPRVRAADPADAMLVQRANQLI